MADPRAAAARMALLASKTHVDHRTPIHDTLCRCRKCKPPFERERAARSRQTRAVAALLAIICFATAYIVQAGLPS
jgi:hypothetical protein